MRRALVAAGLALLLGRPALTTAQSGPLEELDAFPQGELTIGDGKRARHVFRVWLADTPSRQSQGLMFVRSLPPMRGMLFVHDQPRIIGMWMKNTYIPLDMVFIDARGRVQQVVEQTTPHSLATIQSTDPALAVLEIGGGEARRLGIRPGQVVRHPALGKTPPDGRLPQ
jgi:uncharacterized membrane protein (UPF0127 family)